MFWQKLTDGKCRPFRDLKRKSKFCGERCKLCDVLQLLNFRVKSFPRLSDFLIEILYALKSSLAKPSKQLQNFPRTPAPPLHTVFWRSFLFFWQTFKKKNMFYLMNVDFNARKNMFTLRKDEILPPTGNPRLHTVFWRSFLGFLALRNSND